MFVKKFIPSKMMSQLEDEEIIKIIVSGNDIWVAFLL